MESPVTDLPTRQSDRPAADAGRAFVTLDGLRGIAALAIAARHTPFLWPAGFPTGLLRESHLAVDFFFALSGFVLSHAYGKRLASGMSARQFMIVRLIRLYPLYFLALALSLAIAANQLRFGKADASTFLMDALFAGLFLPSPFNEDQLFPLNPPAWSLFFELIANAAFGFLGARLRPWALAAILIPAASILALAVPFGGLGFGTGNGAMDAGWQWPSFGAGLARVAYSFFAGVLVYRLWTAAPPKIALPPVVLAAALCAVLAASPPATNQAAFDLAATLLVFPMLVYLGAASRPGRHAARLFAWLGGISYAVYVLQAPVFSYSRALALAIGGDFGPVSLFWAAVGLILLVALATIADHYYDRPVRRALTRIIR
jgi:peptidoglycan/LPS O-acetylase OafA/YrhL